MSIRITGSGSFIPGSIEKNEDFYEHTFLNTDGSTINHPNEVIVEKFKAITGIVERRYAEPQLTASDIGAKAAEKAIINAGIDPEELDYMGFEDYVHANSICLVEWPGKGEGVLPKADLIISLAAPSNDVRLLELNAKSESGEAIVRRLRADEESSS